MNRRRFLTSATSLLLAPALVRASSLDYVPRGEVLRAPEIVTRTYDWRQFSRLVYVTDHGEVTIRWAQTR